jgi:hypothetical protein
LLLQRVVFTPSVGASSPPIVEVCVLRGADPIGPIRTFGAVRLNVLDAAFCKR